MIKFFRHIRRSLIQENKMGKYFKYAVGEIILVVIGILIALQINNWNEEQKQRIYQKDQLSNLRTEIKAMKAFLNTQVGYFELALVGNRAYIDIAESNNNTVATKDSLGSIFHLALNTDLVTSERLRLETKVDFKDLPEQSFNELEQKLSDWRHFAERIGADFQHIESSREDDLQRAMLNANVPGFHTLFDSYNPPNFTIDYNALISNREVYAIMRYRLRRMEGIILDIKNGINDLDIMLVEINQNIE